MTTAKEERDELKLTESFATKDAENATVEFIRDLRRRADSFEQMLAGNYLASIESDITFLNGSVEQFKQKMTRAMETLQEVAQKRRMLDRLFGKEEEK